MNLRLDWCSYEAAKYAVMHWHYSRRMPVGKLVKIGVWENDVFIGAVIFGRGGNNRLAKSFGLQQTQCVELVRVACRKHTTPISKILSISLRMLQKAQPGLELIVSYADLSNQNHLGVIYQASNWLYLGKRDTLPCAYYLIQGQKVHGRTVRAKWGKEKNIPYNWEYAPIESKYIYVYPFKNREHWLKESLPYPKADKAGDGPSRATAVARHQPVRSKQLAG